MPRLDYEALVSGLPDALVGVDADIRVVLWNPAAEELLGREVTNATGQVAGRLQLEDMLFVASTTCRSASSARPWARGRE